MTAALYFAKQLLTHFPPPPTWDEGKTEAWSSAIIFEMSGHSEEVLEEVLRRVVRNWTYRSTPEIADVLKHVDRAKEAVSVRKRKETLALDGGQDPTDDRPPEQRPWTRERIKLAYDLLPTPAGKLAASEGWAAPFWNYVVTYGHAPQPHEYPKLRGQAVTMDWCVEVQRDGRGPVKAILEAAQFRMANAQRLADIANGKQVPSRADYFQEYFGGTFKMQMPSSPPSKYADENAAEGRGWKGRTA